MEDLDQKTHHLMKFYSYHIQPADRCATSFSCCCDEILDSASVEISPVEALISTKKKVVDWVQQKLIEEQPQEVPKARIYNLVNKTLFTSQIDLIQGQKSREVINLLHDRLHYAIYPIGSINQNGNFDTEFDEIRNKKDVLTLEEILVDIAAIFGFKINAKYKIPYIHENENNEIENIVEYKKNNNFSKPIEELVKFYSFSLKPFKDENEEGYLAFCDENQMRFYALSEDKALEKCIKLTEKWIKKILDQGELFQLPAPRIFNPVKIPCFHRPIFMGNDYWSLIECNLLHDRLDYGLSWLKKLQLQKCNIKEYLFHATEVLTDIATAFDFEIKLEYKNGNGN